MTCKVPSGSDMVRLQEPHDSLPHAHISSCTLPGNVAAELSHVTQVPTRFRVTTTLTGALKETRVLSPI